MKAFVIEGKDNSYFTVVDEPQLENEYSVKVQVESVGICGTDIHIFEGNHGASKGQKRIPGHEFAGVVTEVGSAVKRLKVGDRVVHEPIGYCGKCYACRHGQGNVCQHLKVTGCNMSGGMEEFFVAPEKQWHRIPDWVTWNEAALIEPCTIGAQVCARAGVLPGDTMLIHGAGPIGILLACTAMQLGATVMISEVSEGRLKLARAIGVPYVIDAKTQDTKAEVMRITEGEGANIVCDCAGIRAIAEDAINELSVAGRFVPVAATPFTFDAYEGMHKQVNIISSRLQMNQFVPVIARFKLYKDTIDQMITDVFDFADTKKAFEYACSRNPKTGKIVLRFNKVTD